MACLKLLIEELGSTIAYIYCSVVVYFLMYVISFCIFSLSVHINRHLTYKDVAYLLTGFSLQLCGYNIKGQGCDDLQPRYGGVLIH